MEEIVAHSIRDCNLSRQMWQRLKMDSPSFFLHADFEIWQQDALAREMPLYSLQGFGGCGVPGLNA